MSNETMREKAIIYARVSSKEQEVTGYSLEAQTQMLEDYAERANLEVVKKYRVSESASGKEIRGKWGQPLFFKQLFLNLLRLYDEIRTFYKEQRA